MNEFLLHPTLLTNTALGRCSDHGGPAIGIVLRLEDAKKVRSRFGQRGLRTRAAQPPVGSVGGPPSRGVERKQSLSPPSLVVVNGREG